MEKLEESLDKLLLTSNTEENDTIRSLREWIHTKIDGVHKHKREYIELEIRFGIIKFGKWCPEIYISEGGKIVSDVDLEVFDRFQDYLKECKYSVVNSKTIDRKYPDELRVTTDSKTGKVINAAKKKLLGNIIVGLPNSELGMKISLHLEIPAEKKVPDEPFSFERTKDRNTYTTKDSIFRIDMTNAENVEKKITKTSNEIELEICNAKLIEAFDKGEEFKNVVNPLLNNGVTLGMKLIDLSKKA